MTPTPYVLRQRRSAAINESPHHSRGKETPATGRDPRFRSGLGRGRPIHFDFLHTFFRRGDEGGAVIVARLLSTIAIVLGACILATAATANDLSHPAETSPAPQTIDHTFAIGEDPKFAPVETTLGQLVAKKATTDVNHLCVIGQDLDDGTRQAWVSWKEGSAIILWEPVADGIRDLTSSRRYLRLDRDVVPPDDKRLASGSSYLVSTTWVKGLIAECGERGTKFIIRRRDAATSQRPNKVEP